MDTSIKVGNEISKQSADSLKDLITSVFASAAEHRMDQATVVHALALISKAATVENITITGCSFTGDKTVNVENI